MVLEARTLYVEKVGIWDENYRRIATLKAPLNLPNGGITVELPRVSDRLLGGRRTRQLTDWINGSTDAWTSVLVSDLNGIGWDAFPGPVCAEAITDGLVGFPVVVEAGDTITGFRILGSIYYASGNGATTFDAKLRRGSLDTARSVNLFVLDLDSITQVSTTATGTFDESVTLATPEVVEVGRTYWVEGSATTDAAAYVMVTGVYVTLE
jgi:hypothetical protein